MFVTVSALPLKVTFPLSPDLSDNQMSLASFQSPVLVTSSTSANKAYSGLFPHLVEKKKLILSLTKYSLKHWNLNWKLKMGQLKNMEMQQGSPFIWLCLSSQGKGLARTGTSEVSKRRKLKEEPASPSTILLDSPDRWALFVWAC